MKFKKIKQTGFLIVGSLLILSFLFMATGGKRFLKIAKSMEIFNDAYRSANDLYVEEPDANLLMRVAIDSMMAGLDPYTNYFSEAQMERLRINYKGFWDGVGVKLIENEGKFVVSELIEESAANAAGIEIGDILLSIDGSEVAGRKLEDVEQTLHGKAGTQVLVKMERPVSGEVKTHNLTRSKVVRKNVPFYDMVDENTGYIVLTTFTERAGANVGDALQALKKNHNPKQVILDLRGNGGGLLIEAVNLCNIFLPKGKEIVATRNKVADWDRPFPTLNNPIDTKIPLIILMNGRSASASEIVAGAIQDMDRGVLLGQRSFGKGLVQNQYDVGYNSKIKLTTARYYIPSGRCIQALEYKDGKSVQIADSLRKPFHTLNGRPVYDGGGLRPDFDVIKKEKSTITKGLEESYLIFDFATYYHRQHDSIASPQEFKLTDQEFEDFVSFVRKKDYTYRTESEESLEKLVKKAKADRTYEALKPQIAKLEAEIETAKKKDIYRYRTEIQQLLEEEIVRRFYFERGKIQAQLTKDNDVKAALELFSNKEQFEKLLAPPRD